MDLLEQTTPKITAPEPTTRSIEQFRLLLARGRRNVVTQITDITPALASYMLTLDSMKDNRKLNRRKVEEYKKDILKNRWQGLNGQTIVFSDTGLLNDGQHRLTALVELGTATEMIVVCGVPRESRMTLDQNKVRSNGDYLQMMNVKNSTFVAAVAKKMHIYFHDNFSPDRYNPVRNSSLTPTKSELTEYAMEQEKDINDALHFFGTDWSDCPAPQSQLVPTYLIIRRSLPDIDRPMFDDFMKQLATGENIGRADPAWHVRKRLHSERAKKTAWFGRVLECVTRGWNAHATGTPMTRATISGKHIKIKSATPAQRSML